MQQFIDAVLHDSSVEESLRVATGILLQNLLLKDDIVLQFIKDPRSKKIIVKLVLATKYYTPEMQSVALKAVSDVRVNNSN